LEHLEGLLLREERIFLPNPPFQQSFDQLELLDEEKIGGEIVVSLLKFFGSMVFDSTAVIALIHHRFMLQFLIWHQRFVAAMVLLHTLVFWFIMLLLYAGFQC